MELKKILIDARATQEGYKQHKHLGIGKYVYNLLLYLPTLANDVDFTYLLDPSKSVDETIAGLPVKFLHHVTAGMHFYELQYLATQLTLSKTLAKEEFDLCHFATQDDAALFAPGRFCITILDTITSSMKQLYGPAQQMKQAFLRAWAKRIVQKSSAILTISEHSKKDIIAHLHVAADRIFVTPLGVDERYFQIYPQELVETARRRYGLSHRYCLYIGGIDPRKNVVSLLKAVAIAYAEKPDFPDLAFVGRISNQREYPRILQEIESLGITHRVHLAGYVPEEELPLLYAGASAFIFPSLYEGFGLPIAEAMAIGTPVIASRNSSIPEVGGDALLYVDVSDPRSLAKGMLTLNTDLELARALKTRGKLQARNFSWKETAQKTIDVYRKIIDR